MKHATLLLVSLALAGCAANPKIEDLDCNPGFGVCVVGLEQEGYDWYVRSESECGVVSMENGEELPFCGFKRRLIGYGEIGIAACRTCVRK